MIRRRRRAKEIAFGFDSFLDIVANVVGIIVRMILVVWVGARAYTAMKMTSLPPRPPAAMQSADLQDPMEQELAQRRQELARARDRLLEQLRQLGHVQQEHAAPASELAALADRRLALEQEKRAIQKTEQEGPPVVAAPVSLEEMRRRQERVREEIAALERQPSAGQAFRYKAPLSKQVQTEELIFECRGGRVTFIDVGAFLEEIKRNLRDKGQQLRTRWEVEDVAGPIGPFRLRYTIERERGFGLPVPDPNADFRYGLSGWQIEPILPIRGETREKALAAGSQFRQIVDFLDAQHTVVTFCVYPDSFTLYRELRDYLYQRDLVVAGRPLPESAPIASSRHGSLSRGQ